MRSFFKIFFATFLALLVFSVLSVFFFVAFISGVASKKAPKIPTNAVLVIDLEKQFSEQSRDNVFASLTNSESEVPGLYDLIRLIRNAKTDKNIGGIYLIANNNPNGFAASDEIRSALNDFKTSGKFVYAYGSVMTQKAYYIANVADSVFLNPIGMLDWSGMQVEYTFLKGTLEKLSIEPQIFYAGKFKSATEPLRLDKMSPENKLQTSVWLNDLYSHFLENTATARKTDTATLRQLANTAAIQFAKDAVTHKLVDGLRYDDELKDAIKSRLKVDKYEKLNTVNINSYYAADNYTIGSGEKIALIYAEGDIIDGRSEEGTIGDITYINLIRKARLDKNIKAVVFRINSGGGSVLASENIWRELSITKKEKPVVVSFGDVSASGGYYVSCDADSIFALPSTITGSIGVFGIVPNLSNFFKGKLGVTFDDVKTGPYAGGLTVTRPMTDAEKKLQQTQIEVIYAQFKQRVADGRKLDTAAVEAIAQGRVWTGKRALEVGLIDRFGGIEDAIRSAATLAKLDTYQVAEYPGKKNFLDKLLGQSEPENYMQLIKNELGVEQFQLFEQMQKINRITGHQAKLPFSFTVK
jgi:protease-4